jgi:uncharacterized protein (TIRG00374 family)
MRASSRKLLVLLLGVLVLGLVLYRSRGMLHLGDFSGEKLLHAVRQANPLYLLLSVGLIYVCYALRALRWQGFQKHVGPAHFGNIFRMTLAGFSGVFLLGRAGEPVRPLLIARKESLPLADTFGIYVLERLFDTASTAVIASIGLLVFTSHAHGDAISGSFAAAAKTAGSLLCAGVVVAIAALVYLRLHGTALLERRLQGWLAAHGWRASVARILLGFIRGVQTIGSWGDLALAVFYSTAHWILVVAIYYFVSQSFGGPLALLSFSDAMLVLAFTMVGSTLQLPGVGGGSQALTILAYTAIFGVEKELAVVAAIVLWLITFAACTLAGVPLLIREGWSIGELRRMAKHEDEEIDAEVGAAHSHVAARRGESPE